MRKILSCYEPGWRFVLITCFTLSTGYAWANDLPIDASGWSIISTSSDSRIIYCSNSQGDDAHDGLSEATPVKTLDQAFSLLRSGFPDHVYLKRGDTWTDQTLQGLRGKSGRSGAERTVVAYYGSGNRPLIKVNNELFYNGDLDYIAMIGLEFYNYKADPSNPDFSNPEVVVGGLRTSGNFLNDVLIEDCKFSFFEDAIVMENNACQCGDANKNVDIRRNIIINAYARNSTTEKKIATGMYLSSMSDLLIEENFFDHNGWNEDLEDAQPNQFNHNVYLSNASSGPTLVRGNVLSRGAAHGVQLRSGGTAVKNAFMGNAIGMNLGFNDPPVYYTGLTVADDNVFTDGRPQIPDDRSYPQTGAIWGLWKQRIDSVTVNNNIVANLEDDRGGNVRPYEGELRNAPNALGTGNIGWNWNQESFPATDPGWTDPTRDQESFVAAQGYANYEAWVEAATNREIKSWPSELTAYDYVDYIRAGFDKPAVARPYGGDLPSDSTFSVGDCTFTSDDFSDAQEIIAVSSVTYRDFRRNNSSYVIGVATGIREDGLAGAWEIHNDCSVRPIRRTGQGDNTTRLPDVRGVERARGWSYVPSAISEDGQYIFATAVNAQGFTHPRGWTIAPGTTVAVRFKLGGPFYGRIFGISSEILCDDLAVETFAGNFFVTQCNDGTASARKGTSFGKEQEILSPATIGIYPNPATDALHISTESAVEVTVYDTQGVAVLRQAVNGQEAFDISALSNGLYLVKVSNARDIHLLRRIIKQ